MTLADLGLPAALPEFHFSFSAGILSKAAWTSEHSRQVGKEMPGFLLIYF